MPLGKTKAFHRSVVLLTAEIILICSSCLWTPGKEGSFAVSLLYIGLFCLGGYALVGTRKWLFSYLSVGFIAIVCSLFDSDWAGLIGLICQGIVFLLLFRAVMRHAFFSPKISSIDRLLAGLAGYLLLGIFWETVFAVLSATQGESLRDLVLSTPVGRAEQLYYSFVTLTTLGYGDIIPVTRVTRVAATLCSLSGVIYLAVLISTLTSRLRRESSLSDSTDSQ